MRQAFPNTFRVSAVEDYTVFRYMEPPKKSLFSTSHQISKNYMSQHFFFVAYY